MEFLLVADAIQTIFGVLLFIAPLFLILLILIQRGRGGGLAGAFGGMGGQSAFGTKAGDMFTKITIVAASVWSLLCMASVLMLNQSSSKFGSSQSKFERTSNNSGIDAAAPTDTASPDTQDLPDTESPADGENDSE